MEQKKNEQAKPQKPAAPKSASAPKPNTGCGCGTPKPKG